MQPHGVAVSSEEAPIYWVLKYIERLTFKRFFLYKCLDYKKNIPVNNSFAGKQILFVPYNKPTRITQDSTTDFTLHFLLRRPFRREVQGIETHCRAGSASSFSFSFSLLAVWVGESEMVAWFWRKDVTCFKKGVFDREDEGYYRIPTLYLQSQI